MERFKDEVVIVTGGARGMGASHVRGFVGEGAKVVIADVLEEDGRQLAQQLGERAMFVRLDVTNEADWTAAVQAAEGAFGPASVLINNAGVIGGAAPLDETEPADWRRVLDINLTGQYLGIRAVVPSMRKVGGGSIVNISSVAGIIGIPRSGAYVASKWGVRGLTKVAALELGRENIRVNSVHPGPIRTPMTAGLLDTVPMDGYAIPRIAEPEEITALVLFIASREASFSTGSEFIADGGMVTGAALPREVATTATASIAIRTAPASGRCS